MNLILGSQSIGRKTVLERAGYTFTVMPADIDEKSIRSENYELLPLLLARAKADALLLHIKEPAVLVTSDQVVVCNGELREKPENEEMARRYLRSYATYPAETHNGMVVVNTENGKRAEATHAEKIYFSEIPEAVIDKLIEEGNIFRAAGGYITEDPLLKPFVQKIEGDPEGAMGMSLPVLRTLLKKI